MKYVKTGDGQIPLLSLIAILSISLTVNLPGLAISPLEGKLASLFPHVSHLQIQLLQVLPNVVIIPFILLSGKICTPRNQIGVLATGLLIYALAGLAYIFADSMTQLIVLGCILGAGCGLLIPLAASLISQYFTGPQRGTNLGRKSGLSNFAVIIGTLFVGWMGEISWHLAFLIYLVPLIPLALLPFMSNRFIRRHKTVDTAPAAAPTHASAGTTPHMRFRKPVIILAALIGIYVLLTYGAMVISYFVPFTMAHYHFDTGQVGVATAMFYLAAALSGFALGQFRRIFGAYTIQAAILLTAIGLFSIAMFHTDLMFSVSIFVLGIGYGILQPIIYDKTTAIAPTRQDSTRYFSYLLTGNYIGIALVPFIVDGVRTLFHAGADVNFPYIFNGVLILVLLAIGLVFRKKFVFSTR